MVNTILNYNHRCYVKDGTAIPTQWQRMLVEHIFASVGRVNSVETIRQLGPALKLTVAYDNSSIERW